MPITVTQHLNAPAQHAWRVIIDTRLWPAWGPSVRAVDCGERIIRAGLQGRVLTVMGIWLPFRIRRFEQGRYWDWQVAGLAATGHRVDPAGPSQCRLTFTVPLWATPYRMVCKAALLRIEELLATSVEKDRA
jgi:hypothetical protein